MRNTRSAILSSQVLALVLGLCACTTTKSAENVTPGKWLEASPQLQQRIDLECERLPWTHGLARVELIHWFASVGEPAYDQLLDMVRDPREDVSGAALAALGATRDARLVEPLHQIPWPEGADRRDLRLERARTLLRLGDWSVLATLIDGLRDERLMTRALCASALSEATHEKLGYDPRGEEGEREAAVQRWETWLAERGQDSLLQPN